MYLLVTIPTRLFLRRWRSGKRFAVDEGIGMGWVSHNGDARQLAFLKATRGAWRPDGIACSSG
jgi:hypothetical protein